MPWQRQIIDVILEVDDSGTPYYREAWVTVPRQAGKTTLLFVAELDRCLNWRDGERVLYSAQSQHDAGKKLLQDQVPLLEQSPLKAAIERTYAAAGNQAVLFKNKSRIDTLANTPDAGHGKTNVGLAVLDEAFSDIDDRREQAVIPAMATRRDAQLLGISTAGTDTSALLLRKVALGRAAVEAGTTEGIAYFEWSAEDGCDPDDPQVWANTHPALGYTIDEAVIKHARTTMPEGEFRRAFLNQWTSADERVIPLDIWLAVQSETAGPGGNRFLSVDVMPDRSAGTIAGATDQGFVEIIQHNFGTQWLAPAVIELAKKHRCAVALDPNGPAGTVEYHLTQAGVKVIPVAGNELAQACGYFFDQVIERKLTIRRNGLLDEAISAATKQPMGDSWRWARGKTSTDLSPLMASSLAVWIARQGKPKWSIE